MAQLERIGAMMEQRWSLEGENGKEESRDEEKGSEDGPRESQERETPLSTSCCCGNHLSQRQMITQTVNLLVGYQVGNSQENSTRSLFLIKVLFIQMVHGLCY